MNIFIMKFKRLLFAVLAVSALISCSKEAGDSNPDVDVNEEVTSVTITLAVGDTKAPTFLDNSSTALEKKIYNAVAVAFDKRGLLEATAEADYFKDEGKDPADLELIFEEITTGAHEFYVIANAPTSLLARKNELFPKGMSVTDFKKEIFYINEVNDVIYEKDNVTNDDVAKTSRGFLMSSEEGRSIVLTADGPNNLTVRLVRAVAKVSVAYDPEEEYGGTLKDVKFKVVNNPSQAFVFPTITNGQVYTPLFNSTFYEENYLGAAHDYQDVILNNEGTYTYCMENANMSELQGNSTMVYIKAVFEPTELWDAAGDPMQPTESTFWRIRNENTGIWETGYYGEEPTTSEIGKEVIKFEDGICYYHDG